HSRLDPRRPARLNPPRPRQLGLTHPEWFNPPVTAGGLNHSGWVCAWAWEPAGPDMRKRRIPSWDAPLISVVGRPCMHGPTAVGGCRIKPGLCGIEPDPGG